MLETAQVSGPGGNRNKFARRLNRRAFTPRKLFRRLRRPRRPVLVLEIAMLAAAYLAYSAIRNAVPDQAAAAVARAWDLLRFEQSLQIDIELAINEAINSVTWLIVAMNYFYATMHFVVTIGVLVWLYRWHPGRYRPMRTALLITTALALLGYFFYALAPPRLLPGVDYIDTVVVHNTWGSMASGDLQSLSNQYAAMPSMHAGWSLWCGLAIVVFARNYWVKVAGALYPVMTLVVIVATANHFVLDAVVGWLILAVGFAGQHLLNGRPAFGTDRFIPSSVPRSRELDAAAEEVS